MNTNGLKQFLGREVVRHAKIRQVSAGAVVSVATAFVVVTPAQAISFTPLGELPGGIFLSTATGVSADGSVVVGTDYTDISSEYPQVFRWENGVMTELSALPEGGPDNDDDLTFGSSASGISADGSVVVGMSLGADGFQAVQWRNGAIAKLGIPSFSIAFAASTDGSVIVGESNGEAFRWENGVVTGLGTLLGGDFISTARGVSADGTVIVGGSSVGNVVSSSPGGAVRWENGVVTKLGGGFDNFATAVSANGLVIVGHDGFEAFRWENGVLTGLGVLSEGRGTNEARGVSADGSVVVGTSNDEAFIWNRTNGLLSLQSVLTAAGVDLTGWQLLEANAVSADGLTIVGGGINPNDQGEGWLVRLDAPTPPTSVPEPGTTAALLTSLAGMGIATYQKRKHKTG